MRRIFALTTDLYRKWLMANRTVQSEIERIMRETLADGMMPLGVRRSDHGLEYLWLVFDDSKRSPYERSRIVADRTPPGCLAVVLIL